MMHVSGLLIGEECPVCDRPMDTGSIRFEGSHWAHRSEHPQGGHHKFDAMEVIDPDFEFVPEEVEELIHHDTIYLRGHAVIRGDG